MGIQLKGAARKSIKFAWELVSVILTSGATGAGIGLFEGEICARASSRPYQISFAEGAALFGGGTALVVGPFLYYVLLRRRISFEQFAGIVACAGIFGSLGASMSELFGPVATVAAGLAATIMILVWRASPS
jgi:hypothetical protein